MSPAAEHIARWRKHPVQMVRDLFDIEPDAWQVEALESFPQSPRLCFKACKGPGKTAVLAWIGWNFLLTRPHPMIGATSISGANLRSNFWTEMARWRNVSPLLQHLFEMTKSAIFAKEHPETWKMEARTWPTDADSTQIGNALAGVHAKYVMWLLDESGDYPDAIMPTCEGIFAGEPVEAHIVQAGNPTKLAGPLYRACTGARNLWRVVEISADPDNPKRTPRVSVEHAREQIQQYGRDNPWVLVNIFGQFPPSSLNALIGPDEVSVAMKRYYREYEIGDAPRILGVDVARFGDDASVIFKRQGVQAYPILKFRNIDSTQGAGQVAREWDDWQADAAFVDASGGFGSGWVDQLRQLGRPPIEVHFSGEPHDKARYYNRRAEMYFEAVAWIKRGGALPECPELLSALCATTYAFKGDRFMLAPKDDVKAKIGFSPDEADAFALTFAAPVLSRRQQERGRRRRPYSAVHDVRSWWDEPDHA
jgi:phage terminase large subunit